MPSVKRLLLAMLRSNLRALGRLSQQNCTLAVAPRAGLRTCMPLAPCLTSLQHSLAQQLQRPSIRLCSTEAIAAPNNSLPPQASSAVTEAQDVESSFTAFLSAIHDRGFFGIVSGIAVEHAIQNKGDVKRALLAVARQRPDILFSLDSSLVSAIAGADLPPKEKPERKTTAAAARMRATFTEEGRAAAAAVAEQREPGSPDVNNQASFQDLLRLTWAWSKEDQEAVLAADAGLPAALQSVLAQTLQMLDAEPEPAAAAAAAAAATPSAEQVQVQQAAGAARREAKEKEISRHKSWLARVATTREIRAGDWFCGTCGKFNFKRGKECFECSTPSTSIGCTVVTEEEELYYSGTGGAAAGARGRAREGGTREGGARGGAREQREGDGDWKQRWKDTGKEMKARRMGPGDVSEREMGSYYKAVASDDEDKEFFRRMDRRQAGGDGRRGDGEGRRWEGGRSEGSRGQRDGGRFGRRGGEGREERDGGRFGRREEEGRQDNVGRGMRGGGRFAGRRADADAASESSSSSSSSRSAAREKGSLFERGSSDAGAAAGAGAGGEQGSRPSSKVGSSRSSAGLLDAQLAKDKGLADAMSRFEAKFGKAGSSSSSASSSASSSSKQQREVRNKERAAAGASRAGSSRRSRDGNGGDDDGAWVPIDKFGQVVGEAEGAGRRRSASPGRRQ